MGQKVIGANLVSESVAESGSRRMFDLQKIKEASFEEVLRQMPAAVIIVEAPSGKIIFRNRRAQQWREQSLSQARATKLEDAGDFDVFHPDGRPYEIEEWPLRRCIRDGERVRGEEIIHLLADGTQVWARYDSSPIYDEEGRIVMGVLVAQDITEQTWCSASGRSCWGFVRFGSENIAANASWGSDSCWVARSPWWTAWYASCSKRPLRVLGLRPIHPSA
jgi:PAS domain S-box-containing protein